MSYLRQALSSLVRASDTPERAALAFSIGVFYGFCPLLGLQSLLGLGTALLFRLNKVAILLGVWLNLPWLVIPYYAFATWVGTKLAGVPAGLSLPKIGLLELFSREFWVGLASQWRLLIPTLIGSLAISVVLALLAYPISLKLIRRFRNE